MKAFIITEQDEMKAVVVFDTHALRARRLGAERLNTEFEYVECRHDKSLDKYATNPDELTIEVLVSEHGWYITCYECQEHVYKDEIAIWRNGHAYCRRCV